LMRVNLIPNNYLNSDITLDNSHLIKGKYGFLK
jgi:hypothetical protein